ncbi:c-type cytochrome biogenesis protein CcmI [Pseudooceanicola sp. LIPI14-2-Ac024]|uniref:c-type cytochrome biogenesis protein CcmI n=1 Tax=Pseudooceanicola sp. LIPI14-2-Ac024 TaxID=3344875 RepID=UPI0035D08BF2
MLFWIIAAGLAIVVAGVIVAVALSARGDAPATGGADVAVYRAQLAEVDRDLARGVIGADEAERLKNEIARRLLAADAAAKAPRQAGTRARPVLLAGVGLVVVAGALGLYAVIGAPGYPDLPLQDRLARAEAFRASRPSQAEVEARLAQQPVDTTDPTLSAEVAELTARLAEVPDDRAALEALVRAEAQRGDFAAAHRAQQKVVDLKGEAADVRDYLLLGGYMIFAAQNYVSPEAEAAVRAALELDPGNGLARFYLGSMWQQVDRPDIALTVWDRLLREGPETAPWIPMIRARIGLAAQMAGIDYTPPTAAAPLAGPSQEDIEAARDMSSEDREAMIRGMVASLSDRLATEGGSAAEWARLIGAYGVLGETEQARAIRDEALEVFAGDDGALAMIRAAGEQAGLDG